MPLAQLQAASKSFGSDQVLDAITLSIHRGELIAVLGTNGAGKTTLLRILAGLIGLSEGQLLIDGAPLDRFSEAQRKKIFLLPDTPALFEDLSVLENIETWLTLYRREKDENEARAIDLLKRLHLIEKAHLPVNSLSRGQQYKLALVLLDGSQAPLALIDEPFASGMDAPGVREMRSLFREITGEERTIIYTTQLAEFARGFADRILVIHQSHLHFDGSPSDFESRLMAGDPILALFSDSST
jgi:ABC-type multidrug transport system ATPase subunit